MTVHVGCCAWLYKDLGHHWEGLFSSSLHKGASEMLLSLFRVGFYSWHCGSFLSGQAFTGQETLLLSGMV